jgi:hypothetical protein
VRNAPIGLVQASQGDPARVEHVRQFTVHRDDGEADRPGSSIVLTAACAPTGSVYDSPGPAVRQQTIPVAVSNRSIDDARVCLMRGPVSQRLGTVRGMESRIFEISRARLETNPVLCLAVQTFGSHRSKTMTPVDVLPGQTVRLIIGTQLQNSWVAVQP